MKAQSKGDGTAIIEGKFLSLPIFDGDTPFTQTGDVNVDIIWQAWEGKLPLPQCEWFDCRHSHTAYESRGIHTREICRVVKEHDDEIIGPTWYKDLII